MLRSDESARVPTDTRPPRADRTTASTERPGWHDLDQARTARSPLVAHVGGDRTITFINSGEAGKTHRVHNFFEIAHELSVDEGSQIEMRVVFALSAIVGAILAFDCVRALHIVG